jgi:glycosyltransferase involved in cell wall biosynthesis
VPVNKLSRLYASGRWTYIERVIYAERAKQLVAAMSDGITSSDWKSSGADLIYTRDIVCAHRFVQAKLPVLYEVHDLESRHPGQPRSPGLQAQLERADEQTLREARGVVSLTETFRQELVKRGWQPPSRVFVIPDAYDDAVYFPREQKAMRGVLNLPQDAPIITYAGLTFKYRGLNVLLNAFAGLDAGAHLVLLGGRDAEVKELEALAQTLNAAERTHFVGRKTPEVVAQYLAAADVLVIPDTVTDATASPLKMFEYMAMARPIVCVDRASLREILGDSAFYFARGDVRAFTKVLESAMQPDAQGMGERARARVADFTYKNRAAQIVRAAEAVVRG